jgi:F-type H+-transporting ATPase subunit b
MITTTWVLLAAVAERPPRLIDLDHTVFVQLGIFLCLLLILTRWVFRPYLALRAERGRSISGVREQALELSDETKRKLGSYEEQIAKTRKEAAVVRLDLRQQGEARAGELVADAQQRADAELNTARQRIEKSTQAAELLLRTRADVLAKAVAKKLLGREV